jgi:ATP-dependent DNA helicase RecG
VPDDLDTDDLRHRIWRQTLPPLVVDAEERRMEGARLVVLTVEPGFDLVRVKGKLRERIGPDCEPMTPQREATIRDDRRNYDWSAEQSELRAQHASATGIEEARSRLREAGDAQSLRRAALTQEDLLRECGVLDDGGYLTRGGTLLFCESAPAAEPSLQYLRKKTPAGPLSRPPQTHGPPLIVALGNVLRDVDAINETRPVTLPSGVQQQLETVPGAAIREALVNAVAHRDYRQPDPVVVEHSPSRLVVTSPGELVFGVTEDNILTHVSKPRNRGLAEALRVLRLAERAGTGVDVMVRTMIRAGHEPPVFQSRNGYVRVVLNGGAPVARVAALIAALSEELRDDTDATLLIHYLRSHATADAIRTAPLLQKTEEETEEALRRLSDDRFDLLEPVRAKRRYRRPEYRFRERVRAELGTLLPYHRNEQDEIDRRLLAHLREYDTVSNQTVQNLFQVGVQRASVILRSLADRDIIARTPDSPARGPSVRYERGPRFPPAPGRRRGGGGG